MFRSAGATQVYYHSEEVSGRKIDTELGDKWSRISRVDRKYNSWS